MKAYTMEEETTIQKCTKCGVEKPLSFYYRLGDGHERVCKDCRNDRPNSYLPETPPQPAKKVREPSSIGKKKFSARKKK
jgi:hypothetical protein